MGKSEILLFAAGLIAVVSIFSMYGSMETNQETLFNSWMKVHAKTYSAAEKEYRKGIWLINYAYVQAHNARYAAGLETYDLEMNHFADLTSEEFGALYLNPKLAEGKVGATKNCTG